MTTALETIREDQALGAAWRRCEAALPEGWEINRVWNLHGVYAEPWEARADSHTVAMDVIYGRGPTPTAALEALAEQLETL